MKVLSFARKIAHEEGLKPVSNDTLKYIMWEKTGYPCFWIGDPLECFERQLREAFREAQGERLAYFEWEAS